MQTDSGSCPKSRFHRTDFWEALDYDEHCTVIELIRGPPEVVLFYSILESFTLEESWLSRLIDYNVLHDLWGSSLSEIALLLEQRIHIYILIEWSDGRTPPAPLIILEHGSGRGYGGPPRAYFSIIISARGVEQK